MPAKLRAAWARLFETLWFVPSLVGLGGIALAVIMIELSARMDEETLGRFPRLFGASADSSRSLLSAIAGSIITVAGLTFSLTMVAVTQASGQYTPRVLRTFLRDRPTQFVLGAFVGIFAYCVVVLRSIRSVEEARFVPALAVVLGILMALGGMGALIFFVHHIATTLQASNLIERVARETIHAVERLFPDDVAHEAPPAELDRALAHLEGASWHPIAASSSGYLQAIDSDGLVDSAESGDFIVRLAWSVGDFVIEGTPIAWVTPRPRDDVERTIVGRFIIGANRTIEQDAAFGVRQIVDVAVKALSPGVNDTTTAVMCIDWLGAVLARMANRRVETPYRATDGTLRVIAAGPTFEILLRLSVDEIRQNSAGNVSALTRLLEMLGRVARVTRTPERRRLLQEHVALVAEQAERRVDSRHDRDRIRALVSDARGASATDVR